MDSLHEMIAEYQDVKKMRIIFVILSIQCKSELPEKPMAEFFDNGECPDCGEEILASMYFGAIRRSMGSWRRGSPGASKLQLYLGEYENLSN